MESSKDHVINISGTSITKNTLYNLLGYGAPMLVAVVTIPILVKELGTERFGILSLAWIVVGYFSFFDFGISKSITKITAEKIGKKQFDQIPGLFWTSFFLMLGISFLLTFILIPFVPSLVSLIKISAGLKSESLNTLYILVLSIPVVATTAGLRGVLEAYQKFGAINVIRVFLGIFSFLGPLICLVFTKSLFWIILLLIVIRIVVWLIHLKLCFNVNNDIKKYIRFDKSLIKPVFKFSFWITVANVVGPTISNMDRFLIGALISAKAVAYYATPYEISTKLLLIPSALAAVLFPAFSANIINNPEISKKLFYTGMKFIYIISYPLVLIIVTFSYEGIHLWLGEEFAYQSSTILQILVIGMLINSVAYIPFNFLQGVGKPNIPAILNSIELPFYIIMIFIAIKTWAINGAVYVWLIRISIDSAILFFITYKKYGFKFENKIGAGSFILSIVSLIVPFFFGPIYIKIIFSIGILTFFVIIVWKYFISSEEKKFLISRVKWNAA